MTTLWQDILYGCRMLRNRPGFTVAAVLSLALGIGANTTIFSIINGTLLSSLPFQNPDRLAILWSVPINRPDSRGSVTAANYLAWKDSAKSFSAIGGVYGRTGNLAAGENGSPAETAETQMVTASAWDVLGVKPMLGRVFTPEEDQPGKAAPVAVLSYAFWQTHFNGRADIIGQVFDLDSEKTTVIGVMPKGFLFRSEETKMWIPMNFSPQQLSSAASFVLVVGRLRDGVSMAQARAEMSSIAKGMQEAFPERNKNLTIRVEPIRQAFFSNFDQPLLVLQGAVLFVLLIACANVAGLLLARASARGTEVAVRGALGAGRARLIRQMLTESVILSLVGGVLGAALGWAGLRAMLASLDPGELPSGIVVDYRVLIFTAAISILTGLVFGLAPALQTTKVDLVAQLKEAGRTGMEAGSKQRLRSIMVGAQIAFALILLIGAGLMMTSFLKLRANPLGMDTRNVLNFEFRFGQNQLMKAVGRYRNVGLWEIFPVVGQTYQRIFERMQSVPGVVSAAAISRAPGSGDWMGMGFQIAGQPARDPSTPGGNNLQAAYFAITPGYFQTMRIPVLRGREFNDRDTAAGPPVIVINKAMADRWFPNQNPLGQRIALDFVPDEPMREVIGVVGNTLASIYQRNPEPTMFIPHLQQTPRWQGPSWSYRAAMVFVLRTSGDPEALIPAVRRAVAEVDPSKPAAEMRTLDQMLSSRSSGERIFAILFSIFGAAAALLAAIGIYGVMAYAVAQRTREIGVRMALGASAPNVVRLVLRQVLILVVAGMLLGLAGAYGLTRFVQNLLWNVSPTDPLIFAAVAIGLFLTAMAACLVPTFRATRIDPATALRYE